MKTVPQEFDLRPEDVVIDDRFARRWLGDEEQEAQKIESLARAIDKVGQLYPALVTPASENGHKWILMDGHRRRRAVLLINEKRTQQAEELLKLRVRVETGGDLIRKSLIANVEREGYGPMELACRIKELREDKKWEGFKGAKRIAEYLGIDVATVTTYEKFLGMTKELQDQLGDGIISAQSALELIGVPPAEQPQVLKRAAEIQKEADSKLSPRAHKRREEKEKKTGKVAAKIERPAIRKALKETKVSTVKAVALTRRELLDSIQVFDSPQYGHPNGAVRQWVTYFVDEFAQGKGTVVTMRKRFSAMVAKASKGTLEVTESKPKPKVKAKARKVAKKVAKKAAKHKK